MPLKLKNFETKGQVAALNKWADYIEQHLGATNQRINFVQTAAENIVIPPSTTTSDGIIHGDSIWAIDPGYAILRDDFINLSAVGSPFNSQLQWNAILANSVNLSMTPPNLGGLMMPNNAVASDINAIFLGGISGEALDVVATQGAWALCEYPSWKMVWVFQACRPYTLSTPGTYAAFSWTQVSLYCGLASFPQTGTLSTTTVPRPPCFIGLRYDTDTTSPSIGDTQFVFEAVSNFTGSTARSGLNVQGTTVPTGIVATEGAEYRFEITCTVAGTVSMFLTDGTTTFTASVVVPKWSGTSATVTAGAANGIGSIGQVNGIGKPFGPGSIMTFSGFTSSASVLNGTHTALGGNVTYTNFFSSASVTDSGYGTNPVISGYPAVLPWFAFGNDSTASPVASTKAVNVDFFGFVWNPGIAGISSAVPNKLKARYF